MTVGISNKTTAHRADMCLFACVLCVFTVADPRDDWQLNAPQLCPQGSSQPATVYMQIHFLNNSFCKLIIWGFGLALWNQQFYRLNDKTIDFFF